MLPKKRHNYFGNALIYPGRAFPQDRRATPPIDETGSPKSWTSVPQPRDSSKIDDCFPRGGLVQGWESVFLDRGSLGAL